MPISDFLSRLQARERALLDRLANNAPRRTVDERAEPAGPQYHRLIDDRPRGPSSYLIPPSYRQPVVPLTQAGIFRRYELVPPGTTLTFNNFPNGVIFFTVPLGVIWRVMSIGAILTCDAVAGTRGFTLVLLADAGASINSATFTSQSDFLQIASTGGRHAWMSGVARPSPSTAAASSVSSGVGPLPERLIVYEAARFGFFVTGGSVGDTMTQVEIYVEEWTTFAGTAR